MTTPLGKLQRHVVDVLTLYPYHSVNSIDTWYLVYNMMLVLYVKALVRWATCKRLTNHLPKLSLVTLSPLLNSGILGLRMGPYVPTPKLFYNLWGPRESDLSGS